MFQAKENFLDRIEQSFIVLKDNFVYLAFPFIAFTLVSIVIVPAILMFTVFQILPLENLFSGSGQNISIVISLLMTGGILIVITYLTLLIPFQIGLIRSIKQALAQEEVYPKENILYGFSYLSKLMFGTYWYIFQYVFLIPALVFIFGGFILLGGMYTNGEINGLTGLIGGLLMGVSVVLTLFFATYRGIKSTFVVISAIDSESYTKENFRQSIEITKGKYWRIFGNIFGVGFIGGLLIGLVSGLGNSIAFLGTDFSSLAQLENMDNNTNMTEGLSGLIDSFSHFNPYSFINKLFQNTLSAVLAVFASTFTYILFIRLTQEQSSAAGEKIKKTPEEPLEL